MYGFGDLIAILKKSPKKIVDVYKRQIMTMDKKQMF